MGKVLKRVTITDQDINEKFEQIKDARGIVKDSSALGYLVNNHVHYIKLQNEINALRLKVKILEVKNGTISRKWKTGT